MNPGWNTFFMWFLRGLNWVSHSVLGYFGQSHDSSALMMPYWSSCCDSVTVLRNRFFLIWNPLSQTPE